jgi:ParB family chromosome partitioning protein
MVDESKIAFRPAVELSYLPKNKQASVLSAMEKELCTPSLAQAIKMKQFHKEGKLTAEVIQSILQEQKPNQKEVLKIPTERIAGYFKKGTTPEAMTTAIIKGLELLQKRERSRGSAR